MARYQDSFEELVGFSRSMDRMLSSLLLQDNSQIPALWRPPTDVYETEELVIIIIEIAGMDPDQIQVEFSDKILRVSGRRPDKLRRATAHCLEIQYGEFSSEVYLPGQYDMDSIAAEYTDGFLTISLPKEKSEGRLIAVQGKTINNALD